MKNEDLLKAIGKIDDDLINYIETMQEEGEDYRCENTECYEFEIYERLEEEVWSIDEITGNCTGLGYPVDDESKWEYLGTNLDLLGKALEEFGCEAIDIIKKGITYCDTTIRCYVLGQVLWEMIDKYYTCDKGFIFG